MAATSGMYPAYKESICGEITLWILGIKEQNASKEILWEDTVHLKGLLGTWAGAVQQEMQDQGGDGIWRQALEEAIAYFRMHMQLVRKMGRLLSMDMNDHDLTKTKLVQYALAYLWHWPGKQFTSMKDMAWEVIHKCHMTLMDHFPSHIFH